MQARASAASTSARVLSSCSNGPCSMAKGETKRPACFDDGAHRRAERSRGLRHPRRGYQQRRVARQACITDLVHHHIEPVRRACAGHYRVRQEVADERLGLFKRLGRDRWPGKQGNAGVAEGFEVAVRIEQKRAVASGQVVEARRPSRIRQGEQGHTNGAEVGCFLRGFVQPGSHGLLVKQGGDEVIRARGSFQPSQHLLTRVAPQVGVWSGSGSADGLPSRGLRRPSRRAPAQSGQYQTKPSGVKPIVVSQALKIQG